MRNEITENDKKFIEDIHLKNIKRRYAKEHPELKDYALELKR